MLKTATFDRAAVFAAVDESNRRFSSYTPEQRKELRKVANDVKKQKCLHEACTRCHGTGKDANGQLCVHAISCPCSRCSPFSLSRLVS